MVPRRGAWRARAAPAGIPKAARQKHTENRIGTVESNTRKIKRQNTSIFKLRLHVKITFHNADNASVNTKSSNSLPTSTETRNHIDTMLANVEIGISVQFSQFAKGRSLANLKPKQETISEQHVAPRLPLSASSCSDLIEEHTHHAIINSNNKQLSNNPKGLFSYCSGKIYNTIWSENN